MISPSAVPQFTGDLGSLETAVTGLGKDAGAIRKTGSDVHTQFQGLSAYYTAPEAEQLFASTKPVQDRADQFGDDLEKVGSALTAYAGEVKPIADRLKQLKLDAQAFVDSVKDDEDWKYDGDKIEKHNGIQSDITAAVAAFWAAERACANKITALFGGTQFVANDGSNKDNMYGYSADDLKNAKVPWGTPEEESHHWYEVGHWVKSFVWDGLIVDGIWGTIKGLGTLVGFQGLDAMGQAWKGLAQLATGLLIMSVPVVGAAYMMAPDDKLPSWLRDSRTAVKETGKALVAWDEWGKNPARAAGAVTFNVVTTVFTGGAGAGVAGAGKAGAVAKTLSALSKAGKAIDPMTYITKGAGAGLTKLGDVMAGLKGVGNIDIPPLPANAFELPDGAVKLPDGNFGIPPGATIPDGAVRVSDTTFKLPEGAVTVPQGTVKLPTEAGVPAQYMDPKGNILDGQGTVIQHADDAPKPLDPNARPAELPRIETPVREPALVGANLGDLGRGGADDLGRGPSASHEPPGGSGHTEGPGGGDHTPGAGGHTEAPGAGGSELPAGGHGDGPGSTGDGPGNPPNDPPNGPPGSGAGDSPHDWERPADRNQPVERGGPLEQQVRDQLRGSKVKPGDLDSVLDNLGQHPNGAEIADTIASGRFKGVEGYDQVVSSLSHADKMSGGIEQLRLGNRLHANGVEGISFEVKGGSEIKPGVVTGKDTDLDVMARDADGKVHGYQFKDVQNPKKVVGKIFSNLKQLDESGADFKTFVVDTKGTLADLADQRTAQRLTDVYGKTNVQFVIRVEDGVLTIPPGGTFMPKGAL